MKGLSLFFGILLGFLTGCGSADRASVSGNLQIFCAASLTDVVGEVAEAYSASSDIEVSVHSAGSGTLARQILAGGKADVFLSASEAWMDRLQDAGRVTPDTGYVFARNRLVIAVQHTSPLTVQTACDLVKGADLRLLAMGDPGHVPAGVYGEIWLQSVRCGDQTLWEQPEPRLSPAPDVRAALSQLRAGPDMAALVYVTDVKVRSNQVRVLLDIPEPEQPDIRYSVGQLVDSEAATAWMDFLLGKEGQAILEAHGFLPGGSR